MAQAGPGSCRVSHRRPARPCRRRQGGDQGRRRGAARQRARLPELRALPQGRRGPQRRHGRAAAQPRGARGAGGPQALRLLRATGRVDDHRPRPQRLARQHQHHTGQAGAHRARGRAGRRSRRDRPVVSADPPASAAARRRAAETLGLRERQDRTAAHRRHLRLSRCATDPQRARGRSAQLPRQRGARARHRRALSLRGDFDPAEGGRRDPGAPLSALPRG